MESRPGIAVMRGCALLQLSSLSECIFDEIRQQLQVSFVQVVRPERYRGFRVDVFVIHIVFEFLFLPSGVITVAGESV